MTQTGIEPAAFGFGIQCSTIEPLHHLLLKYFFLYY